jgi:hypothetical protein
MDAILNWFTPLFSGYAVGSFAGATAMFLLAWYSPSLKVKMLAVIAGTVLITAYVSYIRGDHDGADRIQVKWDAANEKRAKEERLRDQQIAQTTKKRVDDAVSRIENDFKGREDEISRNAIAYALAQPDTRRKLCAFDESDFGFLQNNVRGDAKFKR